MADHLIERMAVEVAGDGEPVVMLHGLGGTSNSWTPVLGAFSRMQTVRPDLPGSGRSHRVEGALTVERFVSSIQRVCGRLGIERAHVVGHSLGAIVAFHLAANDPKFVRSLALFGPLAAPPEGARANIRARAASAREHGMQPIAEALIAVSLARDTRERQPVAVAAVRESLLRQCPDGYARTCEALADAQSAAIAKIACPTLLVTGEEDAVAPPQSVRMIGERIAGARVITFPKCGHWTMHERAHECVEALRQFYARQR